MFGIDLLSLVQMAQAHQCEGEWGIVEGVAERTAHLISLFLSEFVYMWRTLHCFPTEEIVIQSFITFELIQVVLF